MDRPPSPAPAAAASASATASSLKRKRPGEEQPSGAGAGDASSSPADAPSPSPTPEQQRRRPRRRSERTLAVLLQALVGAAVVVELKNDAEARGVLQEADDQMNMVLEGRVEYVTARGGAQQLEALYVKGKMVRYVHIAPRVHVGKTIQRHLDSLDVQARRFQRAQLRPQARVPGQHAPLLSSPDGSGGGGGVGGGGGAPRIIQVALPRPAPEAVLPGEH